MIDHRERGYASKGDSMPKHHIRVNIDSEESAACRTARHQYRDIIPTVWSNSETLTGGTVASFNLPAKTSWVASGVVNFVFTPTSGNKGEVMSCRCYFDDTQTWEHSITFPHGGGGQWGSGAAGVTFMVSVAFAGILLENSTTAQKSVAFIKEFAETIDIATTQVTGNTHLEAAW